MRLGPLGVPEIIIIMLVLLMLFGAKRLPELGSSLGKGLRTFKTAIAGEDENNGQEGQRVNKVADDDRALS